jgi:hypothetical protein
MRQTRVSYSRSFFLLVISLGWAIATRAPALQAEAPGQHWWVCTYLDLKDASKPAMGSVVYYAVFASSDDDMSHGLTNHFNGYVQQNYKVTSNYNSGNSGTGYCRRVSDDAAGRANSMDMMEKQWASSKTEAVHVQWTDTPAQDAIIDAKLAAAKASPAVPPASGAGSKECQFHGTCPQPPAAGLKPPGH